MSRRKHKGIRLGLAYPGNRYRVRDGREVAGVLVQGLTREWLDVYVDWYRARGVPAKAMQLKAEWMQRREAGR